MTDSPKTDSPTKPSSLMDNLLGLLRIRVKRGVNLAVRDVRSSDPYVVVKMGKQKLKTRVIRKDINPEWNEDLTLSVSDPNHPVFLTVYDHDTFSMDDKMGDAEFGIKPFIEAVKMKFDGSIPDGTIITRVQPCRSNCLAEESCVVWREGRVVQDLCLRLRNVECGEVELQLQWIELPGAASKTRKELLISGSTCELRSPAGMNPLRAASEDDGLIGGVNEKQVKKRRIFWTNLSFCNLWELWRVYPSSWRKKN